MKDDTISRAASIDALNNVLADYIPCLIGRNEEIPLKCAVAIRNLPSAQPVLTYQTCSDALMKMWMDNVLTDGEYNRIMDKLNTWKGNANADHD